MKGSQVALQVHMVIDLRVVGLTKWLSVHLQTKWFFSLMVSHLCELKGKKVLTGDNPSSHFKDL